MFTFRKIMTGLLVTFSLISMGCSVQAKETTSTQEVTTADKTDMRYFLFISDYNSKGWDAMMAAPNDRFKESKDGLKSLNATMLSYYFGLNDNKGYIIIEVPNDKKLIKALHLMYLPNGKLNSWTSIELMTTKDLKGAMQLGNVLRGKPELNKNSF